MKQILLLIALLLFANIAYSADFPKNTDEILVYLNTKLDNAVVKTGISSEKIDGQMCMMQYKACKDERAILRLLTRHISVADELMKNNNKTGDGQRGLLIAYSAFKCASLQLKDKALAIGIAFGMIYPNILLAEDNFNTDKGRIYIANEILDAAKAFDDDESIIKCFDILLELTKEYPTNHDAYRIKYAYYLLQHKYYAKALEQLDLMTEIELINGVVKLRNEIVNKMNKAVN